MILETHLENLPQALESNVLRISWAKTEYKAFQWGGRHVSEVYLDDQPVKQVEELKYVPRVCGLAQWDTYTDATPQN